MDTYFAPAPRTERRKFKNQITTISHNPIMDTLLKTAAGLLVVLNEDRQIVALNHAFLKELELEDPQEALGLRLGESLNCVHAFKKPNGCGTTEACISCGAAIAMMTAIVDDKPDEKLCALLVDKNNTSANICLLIQAQPIVLGENRWILIYARDVTQQHFWLNLERVFFHDVNNILTSLYGNAQLLELNFPESSEAATIKLGIERLIQEISMQKAFSEHRQEGFKTNLRRTTTSEIQKEVRLIIDGHSSAGHIRLDENWPDRQIPFRTDPLLASRVLGNILINAFEASEPTDTVSLDTDIADGHIRWKVKNKAYIPPQIQKRIFQKHFSTKKETGRGLGTYAMKLFGETYLDGRVEFTSSKEKGTCFIFSLPLA